MTALKYFLCLISIMFHLSSLGQTSLKKVKPVDTNSLITTFTTDSHYVYHNPAVAAKNILVVHLPGSFGEPKRATLFGTLAADLGFHSIGLMYPNAPTVGSFCTNSADAACFENVRREIAEGSDYSSEIVISQQESILSRTQKLLLYLRTNFPSENWGQFLDANDNIIFSKVIYSGHSQGGGHAAIIAKYYPLKRALCFSSPKDWRNVTDAPPLWLSGTNWQTSKSNIYAFNHVLDEHVNHQLEIWDSLGLNNFGAPVNVESTPAPYNFTRQLTTSYNVPVGDDHACTIQDNKTPKVMGNPVFVPVWTYMLTGNLSTGVSENNFSNEQRIKIYPNPAGEILNVSVDELNCSLNIYDSNGKCVFQTINHSSEFQIRTENLTAGIYFIHARGKNNTYSSMFVKQ